MVRRLLPWLLVTALAVAGCGGKSNTVGGGGSNIGGGQATPAVTAPATGSKVPFAKTKFVLHAGIAFGVFHRWIYKPYEAGTLNHPLAHKLAFAKALIATGVVVHEVRLALADARGSKLLSKVVVPLGAMAGSVALIRAALRHHQVNSSAISSANSDASSASADSSAAGQPIKETSSAPGL
jgi:hypothetical protein